MFVGFVFVRLFLIRNILNEPQFNFWKLGNSPSFLQIIQSLVKVCSLFIEAHGSLSPMSSRMLSSLLICWLRCSLIAANCLTILFNSFTFSSDPPNVHLIVVGSHRWNKAEKHSTQRSGCSLCAPLPWLSIHISPLHSAFFFWFDPSSF